MRETQEQRRIRTLKERVSEAEKLARGAGGQSWKVQDVRGRRSWANATLEHVIFNDPQSVLIDCQEVRWLIERYELLSRGCCQAGREAFPDECPWHPVSKESVIWTESDY